MYLDHFPGREMLRSSAANLPHDRGHGPHTHANWSCRLASERRDVHLPRGEPATVMTADSYDAKMPQAIQTR